VGSKEVLEQGLKLKPDERCRALHYDPLKSSPPHRKFRIPKL
jgi:hypothetical protein